MAYENKTVDYVYNLILTSLQEKFNNRLRLLPKAFLVVLAKVLSAIYIIPFKLCGWFLLQIFPDTASYSKVNVLGHTIRPLVKLGDQFGVQRPMEGKAWQGVIIVKRLAENKVIALGTQLKSDITGFIYCVSESVELDEDEKRVEVYCTETGIDGNLADGDILTFVNPIGYAEKNAEVAETTITGTDDETEESYRRRVVNRYSVQPQGGALADYRIWAYDVAGVLQTYPYNDENSPGGVIIYVAGTTDLYPTRVPDSALLVAVGKACTYDPDTGAANRKPLTAILDPQGNETYPNVKAVNITHFNVYVTGLTGVTAQDFGESLKSELETYFNNREPYIRGLSNDNNRTDSILRNSLIATVNSIALSMKATFDTVTMNTNGPVIAEYTLGKGELAALGDLYINGVIYES